MVVDVPASFVKRAAPPTAASITNVTRTGFSVHVHDYDGGSRHQLVVEGPVDVGSVCCRPKTPQPSFGPPCTLAYVRNVALDKIPECVGDGIPACVSCSKMSIVIPSWGWGSMVNVDGLEPLRVYAVSMRSNGAELAAVQSLYAYLQEGAPPQASSDDSGSVKKTTVLAVSMVFIIIGMVLAVLGNRHYARALARNSTEAEMVVYDADDLTNSLAEEAQQIIALKKKATTVFNQHCNKLNDEALLYRAVDLGQLEKPRADWSEDGKVLKGSSSRARGLVRVHAAANAPAEKVVIRSMSAGKVSDEAMSQALCEALLISRLKHKNVSQLYAVVTEGFPVCIVMQWMQKGSLKLFLQNGNPAKTSVVEEQLSPVDLNDFAVQVSCAMEYLSENTIVLKTLQARTIHVTDDHVIKISGFQGVSTDKSRVLKTSEGRWHNCVRWMAPEVLLGHDFTEASDVWAFGVVMWEIYSYGEAPFAADSNHTVAQRANSHPTTLNTPETCTGTFSSTMERCWEGNPLERKPFKKIHEWLRAGQTAGMAWEDTEGGATSGYVDVTKIKDQKGAALLDLNALYGTGAGGAK